MAGTAAAEWKLSKLRQLMSSAKYLPKNVPSLSAYIVPSEDAHQSEYVAEQFKRRDFISGFTGSAGTAVITQNKALLWTDGRYFLQAEKELDNNHWSLMKANTGNTPEIPKWLADNCSGTKDNMSYVGVDPFLVPETTWEKWNKVLSRRNAKLVSVDSNLVDIVWEESGQQGESGNSKPVFIHELQYCGKSWQEKVRSVQEEMKKEHCSVLVCSKLDEIAWLFNLRGADVDFNPVFYSYAIVTTEGAPKLFIDDAKLTDEVRKHLAGVKLFGYDEIRDQLSTLSDKALERDELVWLGLQVSHAVSSTVIQKSPNLAFSKLNPIQLLKAVKNDVEVEGMRNAHIRDAVALCEYLFTLDQTVGSDNCGQEKLTEVSGAALVDSLRAKLDKFVSLSFNTISGSGPNGAVIHYSAAPQTDRVLCKDELYLVDSGGQYLDGTTDVTRTVSFNPDPPAKQKETFTLVLKGHIALAQTLIPLGTCGGKIDSIARTALWKVGLNFAHGTGHGVGAFLNVHEGPQAIHTRHIPNEEGIRENMILSNEPGYYEPGQFGIRIESLIVYKKCETKYNDGTTLFLKPETITCVPLDRKLIDRSLLTNEEIEWINGYHEFCWNKVNKLVESKGNPEFLTWLKNNTQPL